MIPSSLLFLKERRGSILRSRREVCCVWAERPRENGVFVSLPACLAADGLGVLREWRMKLKKATWRGNFAFFSKGALGLEKDMIKLRYSTWDGKVHLRGLPKGRTSLGRTAENDVAVDDLSVSARHCEFEVLEDKVIVRDLDSAGGTFLDGHLVEESQVFPGQTLNLGTFAIRIEASETERRMTAEEGMTALPALLEDGTYSCMRHRETRAEFECDRCYALFCGECFPGKETDAKSPICLWCRRELRVLDWSGMERTRGDVVKDLLPEEVKKVLRHWKAFRRKKSE